MPKLQFILPKVHRAGRLVAFLAPLVLAQQPDFKPDSPVPKVRQVAIPIPIEPPVPSAKSEANLETLEDLRQLAVRILVSVKKKCSAGDCSILVMNFVVPDGNSPRYGMQLADELAKRLVNSPLNIRVVDRSRLQDLLIKDRVPSASLDDRSSRRVAELLHAAFVVTGVTSKTGDTVRLTSRLFSATDRDWSGYSAIVDFLAPNQADDFSPTEPFRALPPLPTNGQKIYKAGLDGVSHPACHYMPNPPYSEQARKQQSHGTVVVKAIINTEGALQDLRVINGFPGSTESGLYEITLNTMKTWRCTAAQEDGQPVPTEVQFFVNFRLY